MGFLLSGAESFCRCPFFNPSERPDTKTGAIFWKTHTATNALGDGMGCLMSGCLHQARTNRRCGEGKSASCGSQSIPELPASQGRIALGPKGCTARYVGRGHAGATDRVVALGPWPAREHIASRTGNFNFSFVGKTGWPQIRIQGGHGHDGR